MSAAPPTPPLTSTSSGTAGAIFPETLKDRFGEIPPDKRLLVVCNSGVRSYEALRQLETAGLTNAVNLQGGIAALKKLGPWT